MGRRFGGALFAFQTPPGARKHRIRVDMMLPMEPTPNGGESRTKPLQVLLDSSALLLATSSEQAVLSGILDIASETLAADAYAVWRDMDAHGHWRAVATRGLSPNYSTEVESYAGAVVTSLWMVEDVQSDMTLSRRQEFYESEGIRSMLVVPLKLEDNHSGTITFYWRRKRNFSDLDGGYASALANLASAALNQNALHAQNQRERQRLTFLAEASAVLASSLDYETTLNRVAQLAVPHIADWCTVHVVEGGKPSRIVTAHGDPRMLELAKEFSRLYPEEIRDDRGLGLVMRTQETEVYADITDEMIVAAAKDKQHLRLLRELGMRSSILVPLVSRGTVLGAIRLLAAGSHRYFTADDVQLAEDLARRAAAAIENARLHRAVVKQQEELRLAHAAARIGSWNWDLVNSTIAWSPEFRSLFELPEAAESSPRSGGEMVHPEDRERVQQELEAALKSNAEHVRIENRGVTAGGRCIWIQSRGTIQRDAGGRATAISGITMDITESRRAEDALRRTEKLATAGRLAATVAHEVNNPLESLTNLIYLISSLEGLPGEARNYLDVADRELNRMAHVVRQTLGFYRESAVPRPVELGTAVAEILDLYRTRADGRSVRLLHTAEPDIFVMANVGEIKQVIANLLANAIDATVNGTVETAVRREGEMAVITVRDSGAGISEENLARLFEPFFTTKADVGTGLGLWVSKGIAEKHSGTIRLTSSTTSGSRGTTASVNLPAIQGASPAA